jgi:type IV secretion system protein VirD4
MGALVGQEIQICLTALPTDRYLLGISNDTILLKKNYQASLTAERKGKGVVCWPLIVTGSKDSTSSEIDDGHVLTIAGAGAGKGVAVVQPNLMIYEGSVVVLDPKGENFLSTYKARLRLGHRVCLLDPFNTVPADIRSQHLVRFNPLDLLEKYYLAGDHSNVYDEATSIAELIVLTTNGEAQPHFNEKAKAFIRSAILFVTYAEVYQDRDNFPLNLVIVKECIFRWFSEPDKIKVFIDICNKHPNLKSVAGSISMIASEERQSVLSTVLRHTEFLDSENVQQSLNASDFNADNLKDFKISIYLVLPANRIKSYSRLARVWIGNLLQYIMHNTAIPRHRVLFMLDEIGQLGNLDVLLQALSLGRGYGLDIWMLFQDMGQIENAYGDSWKTFFANTKYQQFFGIRDQETAKYVSECLGKETIETTSYSESIGKTTGSNRGYSTNRSDGDYNDSFGRNDSDTRTSSTSISNIGRELLQPDEVMRLDKEQMIILMAERYPVLAQKYDIRQRTLMNALETLGILGDTSSQHLLTGE